MAATQGDRELIADLAAKGPDCANEMMGVRRAGGRRLDTAAWQPPNVITVANPARRRQREHALFIAAALRRFCLDPHAGVATRLRAWLTSCNSATHASPAESLP
jgi:hypothetical protein